MKSLKNINMNFLTNTIFLLNLDEYEISHEDSEEIDGTEKHKDQSETPLQRFVRKYI